MGTLDRFILLAACAAAVVAMSIVLVVVAHGAEHPIICTYPDTLTHRTDAGVATETTWGCPPQAPCIYDDTDTDVAWSTDELLCNPNLCNLVPDGTSCMFQFRDPRTSLEVIYPADQPHVWTVVPWIFCTVDGSRQPLASMDRSRVGHLDECGWHP